MNFDKQYYMCIECQVAVAVSEDARQTITPHESHIIGTLHTNLSSDFG